MPRIAAVLVVTGAVLAAGPAAAQFGGIFGGQAPPRPPADVPNAFPPQPPPVQYQGQYQGQAAPPPSYGASPPPSYGASPPSYSPSPSPSGIVAQPLPPPPGATAAPPPTPAMAPSQGVPQRPPGASATAPPGAANPPQPAAANPPPAQPADTSPEEDDTVVTETPTQHIENGRAVFAGLDKITGRTISFDAAIGETVQFGALQVTARACYTRPPTEPTNTDAFVEVDEVTLKGEIKRIFTGWMFASSPGLHAVEHPIYDVWLTNCEAPLQTADTTPPPPPQAGTPVPPLKPARGRTPPRQQAAPLPPVQPLGDD